MAATLPAGVAEARVARTELGLDLTAPLRDILRTIEEDAGLPVAVMNLPGGLAGIYRRRHGQEAIFINGADPVVRRRFTLAHEYGHHRLGHSTVIDRSEDIYGRPRDPQEQEANRFAGEFLMPVPAVALWLEAHAPQSRIDLETVVRMACFFGVSAMAARIRLETARFLGRSKARSIDAEIEGKRHLDLKRELGLSNTYDALEAIGQNDLPRIPQEMTTRARKLVANGLLEIEEVASDFGRSPDEVRTLLGDSRESDAD